MSSLLKSCATVFYWASGKAGGKGVGHISVLLSDGIYVSHVPDMTSEGQHLGTRTDIPTLEGIAVRVMRKGSIRNRTFQADEATFGKNPQSLTLPSAFIELYMGQFASGRMLVSKPGDQPLHGPLPYYQLADSAKGEEDRSQCATTTAAMIAHGVPMAFQAVAKQIRAEYQPDSLWKTLCEIVKTFSK